MKFALDPNRWRSLIYELQVTTPLSPVSVRACTRFENEWSLKSISAAFYSYDNTDEPRFYDTEFVINRTERGLSRVNHVETFLPSRFLVFHEYFENGGI